MARSKMKPSIKPENAVRISELAGPYGVTTIKMRMMLRKLGVKLFLIPGGGNEMWLDTGDLERVKELIRFPHHINIGVDNSVTINQS